MLKTPPKPFPFLKWPVVWAGLFFLAGCHEDFLRYDHQPRTDSSPLGQAQSWYREARGGREVLFSAPVPDTRSGEALLFFTEPSWHYYAVSQQGSYTAVEVGLTDRIGLDFVTEEQQRAYEETGEWKYRRSYTRLVVLTNNATEQKSGFLMTLVPSVQTSRDAQQAIHKTTYFNREKSYGGLVLFHDLNGQFVNGWSYREGALFGKVIPARDPENADIPCLVYPAFYTVASQIKTRNGEEDEEIAGQDTLDAVVVTGDAPERPGSIQVPIDNPMDELRIESGTGSGGGGGYGGGGGSGNTGNSGNQGNTGNNGGGSSGGGTTTIPYFIRLSVTPDEAGVAYGGGVYSRGTSVTISVRSRNGYQFLKWSGDTDVTISSFRFTLINDVSFTAHFMPCHDTVKANPLPAMALEPPNSDNIAGATYGNTRTDEYGKIKFHNGIDLAGEVGTPVYAQFDGTVDRVVSEQPNKTDGNYPVGYTGDKNDAGNRIYISSTVNGNAVRTGYWHLRTGTPIATNPHTERTWQVGDVVRKGDLIGYVGVTGNSDPNLPHLHLTTQVNGSNSNPDAYLNATVRTTTRRIITPCD